MSNPHLEKISRRRFFYYGFAGLAGLTGAGLTRYLPGTAHAAKNQDGVLIEDAVYQGIRESLGKYIYLTPQKLGGGTHAVDFATQKTLAWISYWNYGDSCPISHHLAAYYPDSGDPYKGFEFINSTQGGENILIWGLNTKIKEHGMLDKYGMGNHIYRVGYDGKSNQMELLEDIAETTGIGRGLRNLRMKSLPAFLLRQPWAYREAGNRPPVRPMHKMHRHPDEESSGVSSHHADEAGHHTLKNSLVFRNGRGG